MIAARRPFPLPSFFTGVSRGVSCKDLMEALVRDVGPWVLINACWLVLASGPESDGREPQQG